jgi:hypothetical protein
MDTLIRDETTGPGKDVGKTPPNTEIDTSLFLTTPKANLLIAYNLVVAILACALLIYLVTQTIFGSALVTTLVTVVVAGMLGGTVCNLRGIFTHTQNKGGLLPTRLQIPYYVRPPTGAVTGLLTFFLGHLLVTSLSLDPSVGSWEKLEGRLPFIAIALLAGFAAQEFMERLKALAITLFAERLGNDHYEQLEKLSALRKSGAITEEEFQKQKKEVLAKLRKDDQADGQQGRTE